MRKSISAVLCALAMFLGLLEGTARAGTSNPQPAVRPRAVIFARDAKNSKLTSELTELVRIHRIRGSVAAQEFAIERGISISQAKVEVVIQARSSGMAVLRTLIPNVGGAVEMEASDLILAKIPPSALETLASANEVKIVRRPRAPTPFQTTSEGLNVIGAAPWHAAGRKGAGVKVAILDVGFDGYQQLMGSELPTIPGEHVKSFSGDITGGGEKHGAGVAEIVHDVAPDSDLYLVNFSNEVELENAVQWLIDQHVDVINASWGFPCGGPLDGTGRTNALVKRAADAGILWVSAAGNFAQRHWSATFNDPDGDGWHNFSAVDAGNTVFMNSGDELRVCVEWDDWTSKDQDLDLYVWDSNGYIVDSSTDDQSGPNTHDPSELVSFTASTTGYYYVGVKRDRGTRNPKLHLYAYPPGTECAIESVAANDLSSNFGLIGELRQFRDQVLAPSPYGRALTKAYYRHSPEVMRMLLLHPGLALEAAALLKASRPAVRSVVAIRTGRSSDSPFVISEEYAARIDHFFDEITVFATPELRGDLAGFRAKATIPVGQTAAQYWERLLERGSPDTVIAEEVYPSAGYMRYTTTEMSLVPPADSPYAFTVGAVNWATGALEEFSSRGPTADGRLKPDISAPDGVCTATFDDCGAGGFLGTSAAAPHVVGAAALVKQVYPLRSLVEIRSFLSGRAVDLSPAGPDNQTGAGRLALGSTTDADVLPAPTVVAPGGRDAPIWPTYIWTRVDGAASYRLMVARSVAILPTDPASQICNDCLINTTTSTTYFTPPAPLLAAATYYWQVQGRVTGKNGLWSARVSFTTSIWPELTQPERTDLVEESGPWPTPAARAVVITHGWGANAAPASASDEPWVKEMAEKVCGKLAANKIAFSARPNALTKICQSQGWDIWALDWSNKAGGASAPVPGRAFSNAASVGEMVAFALKAKSYFQIHFIAHSAGAKLIDSATVRLKEWRPSVEIHDTFLDAYEPSSDASYYGAKADWTDNYVDTRSLVEHHFGFDGTKLFLQNGYNIDVTPAADKDPCASAPGLDATCRHSRPYRFYGRSVDSSFVGDSGDASSDPISSTDGQGYILSTENGKSLSFLHSAYKNGDRCAMIGSSCTPQTTGDEPQWFNAVTVGRIVGPVAGAVAWVEGSGATLLFRSIRLGSLSLQSRVPLVNSVALTAGPTESPSYIVVDAITTQPVDKLRLKWRFGAAGQGFLRVFVDGMLVREFDQRYALADATEAEQIYIGGPTGILTPGTHRVAFRLDGFGATTSGVELTEVELGLNASSTDRRRSVRH